MKAAAVAAAIGVSSASFAQETQAPREEQQPQESGIPAAAFGENVFSGDWVTVGIGGGISPSYEGSDDYSFFPAPLIIGSVEGFDFGARGPGLYVDVIRDGDNSGKTKFSFGPQFRVRLDRVNDIDDPVVELLGDRDAAVEVGFTSGVSFEKLLNPFDSLTFGVDVGWDIAGAHDGRVISPSITYSRPLSRDVFAQVSISAVHVDDNYADFYFSIDGAGAAASGLPTFTADGGFKSAGATLLMTYDLSGNALDGGLGFYALGNYSSLLGDAKRSPVTSIRGDADQWFAALGVSYTF